MLDLIESYSTVTVTMSEVGELIKKARIEKGWSQLDLANKTGLSQGTISRIESGVTTPNYQSIATLSSVLSLPVALLNEKSATQRQAFRSGRAEVGSEPASGPSGSAIDHSDEAVATPSRFPTNTSTGTHPYHSDGPATSTERASNDVARSTRGRRKLYGRKSELTYVLNLLAESKKAIIVLQGIAGVGKTAIAESVILAAESTQATDLTVWISAKGRQHLNCSDILDDIALRLDYPYLIRLPHKEKEEGINQLLRTQRSLVVLDELENFDPVERDNVINMFLRLPGTCQFLVTTQISPGMAALANNEIKVLPIAGLDISAGAKLLQHERDRLQLQQIVPDEVFPTLHAALAGNALALKLAIAQFRIAAEDPKSFVEGTSAAGKDMFSYLFNKAWANMSSSAQSAFTAVSLFAGDFSKKALAATAGVSGDDSEAIDDIIRLLLIEPLLNDVQSLGRLDAHQLVRSFARVKLRQSGQEEVFLRNLAMYYVEYCKTHEVRFWEGREAYGYLEKERENIVSIMSLLEETHHDSAFVELTKRMIDFLIVRGDWKTCFDSGSRAGALARKLGDRESYAWLLVHSQGYLLVNTGETEKGISCLQRAFLTYKRLRNDSGQSEAARNLGRAYRKRNRLQAALNFYECSLSLAKKQKDARLEALALNEIGKLERDRGNPEQAKQFFDDALSTLGDADSSIRAGILCNLSGVSMELGLDRNAADEAKASLDFFLQIDNKEGIATSSHRLALINKGVSKLDALEYAKKAAFEYSRLGMAAELAALEHAFGGVNDD